LRNSGDSKWAFAFATAHPEFLKLNDNKTHLYFRISTLDADTKYSKSFCVKSRYPEIQVGFVIIKLEELGMGSGAVCVLSK
jgi:hypothetical protein